ncbi:MAG: PrsW family intramembrane metalloprotease [Chrysiogenales bacterium]|nr:MAG: PrsW family intramembrane metalloprotease [Chrysiogenales bacterium]
MDGLAQDLTVGALLLRIGLGFLPVLTFAVILYVFDNFRLVKFRVVCDALLAGAAAGLFCLLLNRWLLVQTNLSAPLYARYLSPFVEETAKVAYLFLLLRRQRLGFLVDSAIVGFAIGAGFALLENIYFLYSLHDHSFLLWLIRGFGTAVMHGGTVALVGIMAKSRSERHQRERAVYILPGLAVAVLIHSLFNHFSLRWQFLASIIFLIGLPLTIFLVFNRSERSLRQWLEAGFGSDTELLEMIRSGTVLQSNIGRYLQSLKERLPGTVLADMLCTLRLHVELSIKAKAVLMLQEQGFPVTPDPDVQEKFRELESLRRSIGRLGRRLLAPLLHTSARELWQLHMLRGRSG